MQITLETKLLTVPQACRQLGVSDRTFRRMVASGEFPQPIRRNRRWVRVPASDIEQFLSQLVNHRDKKAL